jgi:glycine/D-amino acid oxidase-like deaminating enzyme
MAQRARDLGASIEQGSEVVSILRQDDKVIGVQTRGDEIHAPIVVNAAGGAAAKISRMAGIDIPVQPIRLTAGAVQKPTELGGPLIFIYDTILNTYCRPDLGDTVVIAAGDDGPREVDPDQPVPPLSQNAVVEGGYRLAQRIPLIMQAVPGRGWARMDGYAPDGHAIIGKAPELDGFYMAVGASGKGFKVGPGVGMALAELILENRSETVDLHPFRLERFVQNEPVQGEYPYPNVTIV